MTCKGCQQEDELRLGYCFDCACAGEERAAKRTVSSHILKGVGKLFKGHYREARISFSWAWERLTKSGDYAPGGEFERSYGVKP